MDWLYEGVTVGLTVSAIYGLYLYLLECWRRSAQKEKIRETVQWHLYQMAMAENTKMPSGVMLEKEKLLRRYYESMWGDIETFFAHRESKLTIQDKRLFKCVFDPLNRAFENDPGWVPKMEVYSQYAFKDLRKIEWLNLKTEVQQPSYPAKCRKLLNFLKELKP